MTDTPNPTVPRGIRNNNPGNLRLNPNIMWKGQTGADADGYLTFNDPIMGIRAMAMVLRHSVEYLGLTCLATLVGRYAPSSENDTAAYIHAVSNEVGIGPYQNVDLPAHGVAIVTAMIRHENGQQPYDEATIEKGVHLSHIQ